MMMPMPAFGQPSETGRCSRPSTEPVWLLDPDDPRTLGWAREQSERTAARFASTATAEALRPRLRAALAGAADGNDDLLIEGHRHRIVRDDGPGRSRLERLDGHDWKVVVDLASWDREGSDTWVLQRVVPAPGARGSTRRVLVVVSPGGNDERVTLEVDLEDGLPVGVGRGGFELATRMGGLQWAGPDAVLAFAALGPAERTHTGHPRLVRWWQRGEQLGQARIVAAAEPESLTITARATASGLVLARHHRADAPDSYHLSSPRVSVQMPLPPCTSAHLTSTGVFLSTEPRADHGPRDPHQGGLLHLPVAVSRLGHPIIGALETVLPAGRGVLVRQIVPTVAAVFIVAIVDGAERVLRCVRLEREWQVDEPHPQVCGAVRLGATDGDAVEVRWSNPVRPPRREWWTSTERRPQPTEDGPVSAQASAASDRAADDDDSPVVLDRSALGQVERRVAKSVDGNPVTYFLTTPPTTRPGPLPTILLGYGGFGACFLPRYQAELDHGWLRRGGAIAIAQCRGGGERGAGWEAAGRGIGKLDAVDDLYAVATHLQLTGMTSSGRLAALGVSNGGLLAALLAFQHPTSVAAVAVHNAVLDLSRYDATPAGRAWAADFGTSSDHNPMDLSPLHRVPPRGHALPPMLLAAQRHDDRVDPGHSRTLAHRLSALEHPVWYHEGNGTHRGPQGLASGVELMVLTLSFLWESVGG